MTTNMSFLELVMNASFLVQMVMLALLLASIASWTLIFRKRHLLNEALKDAEAFEQQFWSGIDLSSLYKQLSKDARGTRGMGSIFCAGFGEFARQRKLGGADPDRISEGARRAMHVAQLREMDRLEEGLAFLASVGSTSPYVGLFGTVWGIMNSFRALGNVKQATLAMVAPGIAEALIATAMGLFAAIPAVLAYNRFADKVERLETRYDTFLEEFVAILQRNAGQ